MIQAMTRDFLLQTVQREIPSPQFMEILLAKLSEEGKALGPQPQSSWMGFTLAIGDLLDINMEQAFPMSLAVELIVLSGDVYDDMIDKDNFPLQEPNLPVEKSLLFANWTLMLAFRSVLTTRNIQSDVKQAIMTELNRAILQASWGQWLDEDCCFPKIITEEKYLDVIRLKSGKFGELACLAVALLACDEQQVNLWRNAGCYLGMAEQLKNDAADFMRDSKNDLMKLKMTLPLIKSLENSYESGDGFSELMQRVSQDQNLLWANRVQIREYIINCGAFDYTFILSRLYTEKAFQLIEAFYGRSEKCLQLRKLFAGER
ncbi:polyprenyl synthetase family protein [Effusibacillus lacus]|nr:polyprenyl synthetase family protein [Effusibacillus lacus]